MANVSLLSQSDVQQEGSLTKIIWVLPPEAHLQIMVLDDKIHKPLKQMSALLLRDSVHLLDVRADSKYTLPTCDWVGANYRVLSA